MTRTAISWTDETWNVTRGCRRVSPGCENCYAERQANRFKGEGGAYEGLIKLVGGKPRWSGATKFAVEHLADPLRWKSPRRIFVDSMSDLFYEGFTNEQIAAVFGVMAASPQHTFQVLTKRAKRMREWFAWVEAGCVSGTLAFVLGEAVKLMPSVPPARHDAHGPRGTTWPLPNVWIGTSVENQDVADERIPELLATPAAVRFLSCEPLLSQLDLRAYLSKGDYLVCPQCRFASNAPTAVCGNGHGRMVKDFGIDWLIAGCESGPGARACDVAWLRSLRDQCAAAGVPYFLKQAVAQLRLDRRNEAITFGEGSKGKGNVIELPYLDGVQHAAFPGVGGS